MIQKLRICHMYPDLLNLYGDRGNLQSIIRRSTLRGIECNLESVTIGDTFDFSQYDIIFLGGGQDSEQNILREDLVTNKGEAIRKAVERNKVFLCICGGYQMMGHEYIEYTGKSLECLGAINIKTKGEQERYITDTIYETSLLLKSKILYGFENHSGRTYLGEGVKPLAKVVKGFGNNGEDGMEGAIYKNVYCTYSHGSFLPKNPNMTDYIIKRALREQQGEEVDIPYLHTIDEEFARKAVQRYIQT